MEQLLQVAGALLILIPFAAVQLGRMRSSDVGYLVLNIAGSGILSVEALLESQLGFLLLETVWCLVAIWGLGQVLRGRPPAAGH
jgi:hypothetical protein